MDLLLVALATGFAVSTVDYLKFIGAWRIAVAGVAGVAASMACSIDDPAAIAVTAAAGAFAALTTITLVDRVISRSRR